MLKGDADGEQQHERAVVRITDQLLQGTLRNGGRLVFLSSIAGIAGNMVLGALVDLVILIHGAHLFGRLQGQMAKTMLVASSS